LKKIPKANQIKSCIELIPNITLIINNQPTGLKNLRVR